MEPRLSTEVTHLMKDDPSSLKRYKEKLKELGIDDPYLFPTDILKCKQVPDFQYHDLYHYVVFNPSPYSGQDMKAYKSLDAYFVAGWVTGLQQWIVPGNGVHLLHAKVTHSQRLSEPPFHPWIAMQNNGQVIFGHCTCKAGLGEVCSHVTATLFALESAVRHLKSRTYTDGPRKWGQPSAATGRAIFSSGCNIDFTSPERKRKQAHMEPCHSEPPPSKSKKTSAIPLMTQGEKENFFERLSKSGTKSAKLSLVPGLNEFHTKDASAQSPKILVRAI